MIKALLQGNLCNKNKKNTPQKGAVQSSRKHDVSYKQREFNASKRTKIEELLIQVKSKIKKKRIKRKKNEYKAKKAHL